MKATNGVLLVGGFSPLIARGLRPLPSLSSSVWNSKWEYPGAGSLYTKSSPRFQPLVAFQRQINVDRVTGWLDTYGSCAGCNPVPYGSVGSIPTSSTNSYGRCFNQFDRISDCFDVVPRDKWQSEGLESYTASPLVRRNAKGHSASLGLKREGSAPTYSEKARCDAPDKDRNLSLALKRTLCGPRRNIKAVCITQTRHDGFVNKNQPDSQNVLAETWNRRSRCKSSPTKGNPMRRRKLVPICPMREKL